MNKPGVSRRDFFKLTRAVLLWASGLLGLGGILRFLGYQPQGAAPTEFDLGPASQYPVGSRTVIEQVPAMLVRSSAGFTAFSLTCTHLGCRVNPTADGFTCPCHGSIYDLQGRLLRGPAVKDLPALQLMLEKDGNLKLDAG